MKARSFIYSFFLLFLPSQLFGDYCGEGQPTTVSIDLENKALISVDRQPVSFADSAGINKATIIAEERAKGAMVRWQSQRQSVGRSVESVDTDISTSTRVIDGDGNSISDITGREVTNTLRQLDSSFASANLSGVVRIREVYDREKGEVCVAVAYSEKTINAVKEALSWGNEPEQRKANVETVKESKGYDRKVDDESWR